VHAQCALSFGWERPDRKRFGLGSDFREGGAGPLFGWLAECA
jgi:hypothetical protein